MTKKIIFLSILSHLIFINIKAQFFLNHIDTLSCRGSIVSNYAEINNVDTARDINITSDYISPMGGSMGAYGFPLEFNFSYFGDNFTHFGIGADNFLTLRNINLNYAVSLGAAGNNWTNFILSLQNWYKAGILLGQQDLDGTLGGIARYQKISQAGSHKLVVEYCKVAQNIYGAGAFVNNACSTNLVTNQVILYEGSNVIEFHTKNMPPSAVCPYYSAGPNNAVQGLYYYDANNVAHQVYSPGRGPGDNWGAVGGQYTSRRFTPIPNPPYYVVDTIPYNPWHIIDSIDTTQFFWYDALGNQVSQGPALNATATAPAGQNSTFFVVKYQGPAGCDTFANLTDTFWVHFAENDTTINAAICSGESYNFMGNMLSAAGVYDTLLSNQLGCDSLVRLNLAVNPLPEATINGDNPAITCIGKTYYFSVDSLPGYTYQWYQNGATIAGADSNAYGTAVAGSYSVRVTSHLGCSQMSEPVLLQVMPLPQVNLSADKQNICAGDTVTLQADAQNIVKYEWFPASNILGDSVTSTAATQAIVIDPGLLWVKTTDANGCQASDTVAINTTPCCEIYLPTAFSPNNDGNNDVFKPNLGPGRTVLEMKVFSRWGNTVYQCYSNHCDPWTGIDYLGRVADIGVYHYYLKYQCADGKEYTVNGELTLLR